MRVDISTAALGRALDFFGSHAGLARALATTSRKLWQARKRGQVNRAWAEKIHRLTAGTVRMEELRPDLYPRERHFERVRIQRARG